MHDSTLGKLLDTTAQRDAIHIAIAPVIANGVMGPGAHIGFIPGSTEIVEIGVQPAVGIVDPFLTEPLKKGDRFFMCLYPNTVTGMRHHWEHPAFRNSDVEFSRKWLEVYAARMNCYDEPAKAYERLIEGIKDRDLFANGSDLHGFYDLEDAEELKRHAEIVLGIKIEWEGFAFTCSC